MDGDIERWRIYFRKAGVDIWSVIQHAIHVAAMDYPKDFRCMRAEIAETLFARELAAAEPVCTLEEGEVRHGPRDMVKLQAEANDLAYQGIDDLGRWPLICHDEAEALTDDLEEESLVLREVNSIKETCIDVDQPESVVFAALQRLKYMHITVQVLKATEIGKKVNGLRKHLSMRVRTLVKELVRHWKLLVDEWMVAAKEVTVATTTTTAGTECGEFLNQDDGLALPPLDEGALLEARASPVELSQLFSFISEGGLFNDDRDAPAASSVEPSVKDNLNHSCLSQSGSMLTDSSDFDTKASTSHPWDLRMSGERGSATLDLIEVHERETVLIAKEAGHVRSNQDDGGLMKNVLSCSGPGRPASDMGRKEEITSSKWKTASTLTSTNRNGLVHRNDGMQVNDGNIPAMKSDKSPADQKLEIAKRKLHRGYQEAENAKKQRTVQVLDFLDLPKPGQALRARGNPPVQVKSGPRRSHNGRYS